MSNLTSQIEAMAKKLRDIFYDPNLNGDEFDALARHALKLELEARIDSLGKVPAGMFDSSPYVQKMINELTTQLNQLEQ